MSPIDRRKGLRGAWWLITRGSLRVRFPRLHLSVSVCKNKAYDQAEWRFGGFVPPRPKITQLARFHSGARGQYRLSANIPLGVETVFLGHAGAHPRPGGDLESAHWRTCVCRTRAGRGEESIPPGLRWPNRRCPAWEDRAQLGRLALKAFVPSMLAILVVFGNRRILTRFDTVCGSTPTFLSCLFPPKKAIPLRRAGLGARRFHSAASDNRESRLPIGSSPATLPAVAIFSDPSSS